ncbi:hypothetical protein CHELA20_10644 [Hyphomicrobiales bacterium]|nr:hypothetical protein CHELA20_10644 [Hyphomicrobiales bacterium]CAH1693099.1 hypothetical protein CHELA41_50873 [Hyphomicrobiales bacterium]
MAGLSLASAHRAEPRLSRCVGGDRELRRTVRRGLRPDVRRGCRHRFAADGHSPRLPALFHRVNGLIRLEGVRAQALLLRQTSLLKSAFRVAPLAFAEGFFAIEGG